jgi:hypothetical protein
MAAGIEKFSIGIILRVVTLLVLPQTAEVDLVEHDAQKAFPDFGLGFEEFPNGSSVGSSPFGYEHETIARWHQGARVGDGGQRW